MSKSVSERLEEAQLEQVERSNREARESEAREERQARAEAYARDKESGGGLVEFIARNLWHDR